jgi:tRNA(fMet)-specific endonuclease VapC
MRFCKKTKKDKNLLAIQVVSKKLTFVNFNAELAQLFGRNKADLKQQGNIILDADIMIAAIALSNRLTLVTNNEKHFIRIPDLSLENWVIIKAKASVTNRAEERH